MSPPKLIVVKQEQPQKLYYNIYIHIYMSQTISHMSFISHHIFLNHKTWYCFLVITQCSTFSSEPQKVCWLASKQISCDAYAKYRTIDGSCNNLNQPTWGQSIRPLARLLPPQYEAGIYTYN